LEAPAETAELGGDSAEDPTVAWRFEIDDAVEWDFGSPLLPTTVFFLVLPEVETAFFSSSSCFINGSDSVPTVDFVGDAGDEPERLDEGGACCGSFVGSTL